MARVRYFSLYHHVLLDTLENLISVGGRLFISQQSSIQFVLITYHARPLLERVRRVQPHPSIFGNYFFLINIGNHALKSNFDTKFFYFSIQYLYSIPYTLVRYSRVHIIGRRVLCQFLGLSIQNNSVCKGMGQFVKAIKSIINKHEEGSQTTTAGLAMHIAYIKRNKFWHPDLINTIETR